MAPPLGELARERLRGGFPCSTWNNSLLRSSGGDAHGVLDVAVLLFPVGGGGHAVIGHQTDGVVDGIDKDAHVPHHRDAVPSLGRAVQQLLDVAIGLTGVQAAFGDGDECLAAAVLRQAQHPGRGAR